MMSTQPETKKKSTDLTRRDLLRRSAVGAATVGGVSAGAIRLDHGPVQESEAIAPAVAAAGIATSAGVSLGWSLRDYDPLGSDDPPGGLTAEALYSETYSTLNTRASTNASTIVDNKNIVEGLSHTLWADAKIAAIEKLNDQESQEVVLEAAEEALDDYAAEVQSNLFKTWNEAVEELKTYLTALEDHPDADPYEVLFVGMDMADCDSGHDIEHFYIELDDDEIELVDGSTMEIHRLYGRTNDEEYGYYSWSADDIDPNDDGACGIANPDPEVGAARTDSDGGVISQTKLLRYKDWEDITDTFQEQYDEVEGGLHVWVDGVYSDVQSGELDTEELLTPREQAELTAEDEDFPQAIADLQALNVSVDLEREAEIYFPEIEATVWGQIGYNGEDTLETGQIDPDDKDGSIYLTYDISQGQGEWSAYEEGIDGGELTFTAEPFVDTIYYVDTVAGETVELTEDDFEPDDGYDEWTTDLSDELEDAITDVEQIEYYAETEETQYETIQLQDEFEIVSFEDSDGNEHDSADFERSEPHDDDNYITEEEWKENQERHEELIEKYEDAQGGGGIPGVDDFAFGGLPGEGVLLAIAAVIAALLGSSS